MIFLEKSEIPFSKRPTKNFITPSPEKMSNPLKRKNSITPPPLFISQSPRSGCFLFFPISFTLKKNDNAQLCTGNT